MKTDRELLELAAKAAGLQHQYNDFWDGFYILIKDKVKGEHWDANSRWDPLTDDGDALRLAFALKIDIEWQATQFGGGPEVEAYRTELDRGSFCASENENDYRRAIVRAAAEIALATKETA